MRYRWTHVVEQEERQWLLKRNCALTPRQLAAWFATLGAVSMGIALLFAMQGAWMVVPFACIELTVLGVAFFVYARHAADYERILLGPRRLVVERATGGDLHRVVWEPDWIRVEYAGTHRAPVRLLAGSRQLDVGRFVPDEQRKDLARELRESLAGSSPTRRA